MKNNEKMKNSKTVRKSCSCWMKGGLLGVAIFLAFALLVVITKNPTLGLIGEALEGVYLTIGLIGANGSIYWIGWAYSIIVWFIIGAVIGLIIGELRAKK